MRPRAPSIVKLAILASFAAPAMAALNMNEGLWETTITADGQAQSANARCYTRADIAEMERRLQGKSTRVDGVCRYEGFTQSGNSVNYTMTCRLGDDEQTSAVSATYRGPNLRFAWPTHPCSNQSIASSARAACSSCASA